MNEISLNDLKNKPQPNEEQELRKVEISQIAKSKTNDFPEENQKSLGQEIDAAINRVKQTYVQEYIEEKQKQMQAQSDEQMEKEINEISDEGSKNMQPIGSNLSNPEPEASDELPDDLKDIIGSDHVKPIIVDQNTGRLVEDPNPQVEFVKPPVEVIDTQEKSVKEASVQEESTHNIVEKVDFNPEKNFASDSIKAGDDIDEEDFDDLDLDEEEKNETETDDKQEELKQFSNEIAQKINPISNVIDLHNVTVVKKPLTISNALLDFSKNTHVSDWVLYADKYSISMESFTGTEIDELDARRYGNRNRYNTFLDIYGKMYNKIPGLSKKMSLEAWLKTTNFFSANDLWFAVYKASFEKSNIVPYECPHCKKAFLREPDIMKMVKFKNKTAESNFNKIFNSTKTFQAAQYPVRRVQISDKFVVDLKEPSIWNVIFENAILDDKFRQKYASLLTTITYIDALYMIRPDGQGGFLLQPIEPKREPENMLKDIKYKVYTYAKILQTLTSDERALLQSNIDTIIDSHDEVAYQIPETTCEYCKKEIKAQEMTAESILFTRQGLADLANFSQK